MKIRVAYSELKSDQGFNNRRASAEMEIEVIPGVTHDDINTAFVDSFEEVIRQVKDQLIYTGPETSSPSEDTPFTDDDVPF